MMNTQMWVGGTEEEYETQHFGFGSQCLKIAVREMIEQKIKTGVKDMEAYLQETLDLNDTDKHTLTYSCDKLIRMYSERASPCLEIIDSEIEKMLKIPANVLLPEDEAQLEQVSDDEYQKLKEEIASLKQRVERGALMEALLTAEDEELTSFEKICEIAKKDMEVIDLLQKSSNRNNNIKMIPIETQFLISSAPFLNKDVDIE